MAGGWGGRATIVIERDRTKRHRNGKSDVTLPYLKLIKHFINIIITLEYPTKGPLIGCLPRQNAANPHTNARIPEVT